MQFMSGMYAEDTSADAFTQSTRGSMCGRLPTDTLLSRHRACDRAPANKEPSAHLDLASALCGCAKPEVMAVIASCTASFIAAKENSTSFSRLLFGSSEGDKYASRDCFGFITITASLLPRCKVRKAFRNTSTALI